MILLNTPQNPLGKVYSREELEMVAQLCRAHDVICVMDEVYEWIIYEGVKHVRMNTLPDMWERTITIGSAGKAFSITGWRVGWAYGPQHLLKALQSVHHNGVYACSTILQEAVAVGLEKEMERTADQSGYWKGLSSLLQKKRDYICGYLSSLGVTATVPQGSYFIVCDFSRIASKLKLEATEPKHLQFSDWLHRTKDDSTLRQAAEILMELETELKNATGRGSST
ncbi:kynurenine aminotransferase-like isoform X2 [Amblyomma americanum]